MCNYFAKVTKIRLKTAIYSIVFSFNNVIRVYFTTFVRKLKVYE